MSGGGQLVLSVCLLLQKSQHGTIFDVGTPRRHTASFVCRCCCLTSQAPSWGRQGVWLIFPVRIIHCPGVAFGLPSNIRYAFEQHCCLRWSTPRIYASKSYDSTIISGIQIRYFIKQGFWLADERRPGPSMFQRIGGGFAHQNM